MVRLARIVVSKQEPRGGLSPIRPDTPDKVFQDVRDLIGAQDSNDQLSAGIGQRAFRPLSEAREPEEKGRFDRWLCKSLFGWLG